MERRNRNILVGLIGVVIVIAVFSSFGLPLFASPTPTIVLPTPVPTDQEQQGEVSRDEGLRVEVTPQTVQNVTAAMPHAESYYRTFTTLLEGAETRGQVWVDGDWTRADLTLPGGGTVHTIQGAGTVWRWYNNDRTVITWAVGEAPADIETQRLPTYQDVLALPVEDLTAAGYEEKNGQACVYVETAVPVLDQVERYWVSSDNGLLVAAETETGGAVVWSMTAGQAEVPVPAGASFTLPDGTVLH